MLDFEEVGRRIEQRNCACGQCRADEVPHEYVVSPLIGQLLDPEYVGENGVLIAPHECANLALTIQRQAQMLDKSDQLLSKADNLMGMDDELMDRFVNALSKARQLALAGWGLAFVSTTVLLAWLI